MNLHPRTHSNLLSHIVGSQIADGMITSRMACFFKRGYNQENEIVSLIFRNCMLSWNSYMCRNMHHIARVLNTTLENLLNLSEAALKNRCKGLGVTEIGWREGMVMELLRCRDGTVDAGLNSEEINDILTQLCIE